jgi:tRNA 5-methylaminomethyl-2-thiouridine biosynthesis bifunctional protein
MSISQSVQAACKAWEQSTRPFFTVLDASVQEGLGLAHLLQAVVDRRKCATHVQRKRPRLRLLAVLDAKRDCPLGVSWPHCPGLTERWPLPVDGLHHVWLEDAGMELVLFFGPRKAGLQAFQSVCVDAVVHEGHPDQYRKREAMHAGQSQQPARKVAVVGAGIAGSAVARALCELNIEVTLYDAEAGPAQGASGNWVGAFHPHITRGDSPLSKLSRLGHEHTVQALMNLTRAGFLVQGRDWDTPGHLQTVAPEESTRVQDTLTALNFPKELVQWSVPNARLPTPHGGLFFPSGGWVKPARWVQANLQACGDRLRTCFEHPVGDLEPLIQTHDAVVVCAAQHSLALAPVEGAKVGEVKGQISKVRRVAPLDCVLSGESYAIAPPMEDWMVLGATYERPATDLTPTAQADAENLARFNSTFPQWPVGELLDHRCAVRFVWHDRLPAIGPVAGVNKVYLSTGFASRGLLWAALGAWVVAAHCAGQPMDLRLTQRIKPRGAPG